MNGISRQLLILHHVTPMPRVKSVGETAIAPTKDRRNSRRLAVGVGDAISPRAWFGKVSALALFREHELLSGSHLEVTHFERHARDENNIRLRPFDIVHSNRPGKKMKKAQDCFKGSR